MADALPHRLLALSVLQILTSTTATTGIRPSALATLTHVAASYVELLAESAKASAELSGRTSCTGWDLVGVLEAMDGAGGVEGLFGWCRENARKAKVVETRAQRERWVYVDPVAQKEEKAREQADRLGEVAQVLEGPSSKPPAVPPVARLSFLRLSEEEMAALDRAGESDLDGESFMDRLSPPPKPTAPSSSDSEESDSDSEASTSPPPDQPLVETKAVTSSTSLATDAVEPAKEDDEEGGWRSKGDIPLHVPFFLPPFPGLERTRAEAAAKGQVSRRELAPLDLEDADEVPPPIVSGSQKEPYSGPVAFAASMLHEAGPSNSLPRLRTPSPPPGEVPPTPSTPFGRKRRREDPPGSLSGYLETVSTLMDPSIAPADLPFLAHSSARRKVAAVIDRPDPGASASLSAATILPAPHRCSRRTAGWLPYSTGFPPEMKPFASVLPDSVTSPVPDSTSSPYPVGFLSAPSHRNPSTVALLLKTLSTRDPKTDPGFQEVVSRITRTGPPAPLGADGEALPYVVEPATVTASGTVGETRYLEWGFEWQGIDPGDALPPPRAEQPAIKVPPLPAMPKLKTNEEREREKGARREPDRRTSVVLKIGGGSTSRAFSDLATESG